MNAIHARSQLRYRPTLGTNNPLILAVLRARVKAFRKIPPILRLRSWRTVRQRGDDRNRVLGCFGHRRAIAEIGSPGVLGNARNAGKASRASSVSSVEIARTRSLPRTTLDASREVKAAKALKPRGGIQSRHDRQPWGLPGSLTMKSAALLVALFTVTVGVVGLVSPASVTAVRRQVSLRHRRRSTRRPLVVWRWDSS